MANDTTEQWSAVEQWSPTLFLIGGALLIGHAATSGIQAFTDLPTPPDVFVTAGHLIALVGLVGLYPALADRSPIQARVATAVAMISIVGWVTMTVAKLFAVAGMATSLNEVLPGAVIMLVVGSTIITYVMFGVVTLRGGDSRTVGLLVLAPAALIVVLLVDAAITGTSALDGLLIGGGLALSMLALGHKLRSWDRPTEHAAPASDTTAG